MKTKILNQVYQILSLAFVFLLPIVFIPLFTDPYEFGREVFILAGAFIIFWLFIVKSVVEKKLVFQKNSYFLPAFFLFLAFTVSSLVNAPNKTASLLALVGPASLFLAFLALVITTNLVKRLAFFCLLASGVLMTIVSLVLFLGKFAFPLNYPSLNITITRGWSLTGSALTQTVILLMLIPLGFALLYEEVQKKNLLLVGLTFVANILILCGTGIILYLLTNDFKPLLLPQLTGWSIAAETIKTVRFALLGVGPGQFANAFTSFRPLSFNNTDLWNLRFGTSSNLYFQLLTEVGFLGLVVFLALVIKIFKNGLRALREEKISPLNLAVYASLVIFIITQFFIPLNFTLLAMFFVFLGLTEKTEKTTLELSPLGNLIFVLLAIPLVAWGAILFFGGKVALADYYFLGSIKAANQNDGIKTYNLQIKSIQTNTSAVNYRIAYSQTNFALANSLAAKKDLTDNDRNTISQLIQQSLREAKAAVTLDPANATAWENLSSLYRNLINFAQGADQWSIASYQEAIRNDPLNPRLRIDLGGIYYSLKNFNQAASLFLQATNLKSDYANAHYNLANALRELGALADAKKEYETTQTLVAAGSNDYQKVTAELEEVEKRLPTPTPATGKAETLSTPQAPTGGIEPPLNLPNEGPPGSITPSPTPSTP